MFLFLIIVENLFVNTLLFSTVQLQVPEKYKKLLQRDGHCAAKLTANSDCVEVILFGGRDECDSLMADTTILRLGECFRVSKIHLTCHSQTMSIVI